MYKTIMNPFQDFAAFQNSPQFNAKLFKIGTKQELLMLPTLKQFFNDDTLVQLPDGSHLDFVGKNQFIELKTRYINYTFICGHSPPTRFPP